MKKLLFIAVLLLLTKGFSQTDMNVEKNMFKVNFLMPGFEYEHGVTKNTTLQLKLGTSFTYESTFGVESAGVFVNLEAQYRYYYNFDRRIRKEKNINKNSGNYLSLMTLYQPGQPILGNIRDYNDAFVAGPVYGLQRTYNSGFNWGLETGVVFYSGRDHSGWFNDDNIVMPWLSISIGWVIGK